MALKDFHLFSFLPELSMALLIPISSCAPVRGGGRIPWHKELPEFELWLWPSLAVGKPFNSVNLSFHVSKMVVTSVPTSEKQLLS